MSGDDMDESTDVEADWLAAMNGARDKRRMHWVMVG